MVPKAKLRDICTRITSGGTPSRKHPEYFATAGVAGHLWVKSKELLDGSIGSTEECISELGLKNSSAKYLPPDTVLVAMYGVNVGQLAWLRCPATVNQAICGLIVDPKHADPRYVFYALKETRAELIEQAQGAAQQNLNQDKIKDFPIPLPLLSEQRRIASILSAYDDLIENNTRRIAILEEMARRIYEEWFVHFRFPGYEHVRVVESELGPIPDGWRIREVKGIVKRLSNGKVFKQGDVQPTGSVAVIDQSTAELLGFHDEEPSHVATPAAPLVIFGDHTCKMQLLVCPFSLGPNTVAFTSNGLPVRYVYAVVRGLVSTREYKRHWSDLMKKQVLTATEDLANQFAGAVKPYAEMTECLRKANRNLRSTSDLLLPKLISGELDVSEVPEPEAVAA